MLRIRAMFSGPACGGCSHRTCSGPRSPDRHSWPLRISRSHTPHATPPLQNPLLKMRPPATPLRLRTPIPPRFRPVAPHMLRPRIRPRTSPINRPEIPLLPRQNRTATPNTPSRTSPHLRRNLSTQPPMRPPVPLVMTRLDRLRPAVSRAVTMPHIPRDEPAVTSLLRALSAVNHLDRPPRRSNEPSGLRGDRDRHRRERAAPRARGSRRQASRCASCTATSPRWR